MPAILIDKDDTFEMWRTKTNQISESIENVTAINSSIQAINDTVSISTVSTERFIVDAIGNIGESITPSAWATANKAYQMPAGALYSLSGTTEGVVQNAYLSGTGWKYVSTGYASRYEQYNGTHYWFTAESGSADSNVTFSQKMVLSTGGNLGIGLTPTLAKVHISNTTLSGGLLAFTGNNNYTHVFSSETASDATAGSRIALTSNSNSGEFSYANSGGVRFQINSSGNVGVGTSTPSSKLDVAGLAKATAFGLNDTGGAVSTGMAAPATDTLGLYTNTVKRVEINSSGNVGIGRAPVAYGSFKVLDVAGNNGAIQKLIHTGSSIELQNYVSSTLAATGTATNHPYIITTNDIERVRVDSLGNVGIGTTNPNYGGWDKTTTIFSTSNTAFEGASSRATADTLISAFTAVQTNNTSKKTVAQISTYNTGATASDTGGYLSFHTKPDAGILTERLRITSTGDVLVTGPGGLGYGTGSGGTVTQTTDKSTTVTLNKTNGQIQLTGSSISAGSVVSFQLNNNKISSTDTVYISVSSGMSSGGSYNISVDSTANGSCIISIRNLTGGTLSEPLILNFAVLKVVTA